MASSFDELLLRNNYVSIHVRNIQLLTVELYKVANGLSPEIMSHVFPFMSHVFPFMSHVFPFKENHRYPTTTKNIFKSRNVRCVNYGTESLSHLGPKIWSLLPDDLKNNKSLNAFKINIKQRRPTNYAKCIYLGLGTLKVGKGFYLFVGFYFFI